jgi:hypothetical protein
MLRKSTYVILLLLLIVGCSRKGDEELPPIVGDLEVRFQIQDQFGLLPDTLNIPVIVALYVDSLHTREVASDAVSAQNHVTTAVLFENIDSDFFYLKIRINLAGLPSHCPDHRVFVVKDMKTTTDIVEIEIRQNDILCRY